MTQKKTKPPKSPLTGGLEKQKRYLLIIGLLLIVGLFGIQKKLVLLSGDTMGTTYHISAYVPRVLPKRVLQKAIRERLDEINKSMSTYQDDSEISKFNRLKSTEVMSISTDFYRVLKASQRLYELTNGAWDGSVKPLLDLWGFSSDTPIVPSKIRIQKMLKQVGFNQLVIGDHQIRKKNLALHIDLSSIAKGYGVDEVARVLRRYQSTSFLVEIGGEMVARGTKKGKKPWVVGINQPRPEAKQNSIFTSLPLKNKALATSGDYRHFFKKAGKRYSHVLDPRTGYPVSGLLASVSVIAPTCMLADGLATALMVMPLEEAQSLVFSFDNVEALWILRLSDGSFNTVSSLGFPVTN